MKPQPVAVISVAVLFGCATTSSTSRTTPENLGQPGARTAPVATADRTGAMAPVKGATFVMGSDVGEADERPAHKVHVASFEIDLTEVTVAQYTQCVKAGGCQSAPTVIRFPGVTLTDEQLFDSECNDDRPERQDYPENCVDWGMAEAYCRWADKRLPTEDEWEYAACSGDCDKAVGRRGGATGIVNTGRWPFTTHVASAKPGPFGLYDMADNVWEWTASPYCPYNRPDCGDSRRVIRGGSWSMADVLYVRLTARSPADPSNRNVNVGVRCARSLRSDTWSGDGRH